MSTLPEKVELCTVVWETGIEGFTVVWFNICEGTCDGLYYIIYNKK